MVAAATFANIRATLALLGGTIDNRGDADIEERGIVISRSVDQDQPEIDRLGVRHVLASGTEVGAFTVEVDGLIPGTAYSFRAYAKNHWGYSYSETETFTTLALEVSSPTAANLTETTATLGGEVITDVPAMVEARGVVYAEAGVNDDPFAGGPGVTNAPALAGGAGVFTVDVAGLTPGAEYAFKAYATISGDTVYSETAFFPESGGAFDVTGEFVSAFAALPDGRMLVGGMFREVDGEPRDCLVMLLEDGFADDTYTAGVTGFDNTYPEWIQALAVQADGKIVIGGLYNRINGTSTHASFGRLNADGTEDGAFSGRVGPGNIECLAIQPDGKLLVGGYLISLNEHERHFYLGRLNADGTLDGAFNPGPDAFDANAGPNGSVRSIQVQPDGELLVAGFFSEYAGQPRPGLARLHADGSLDAAFDPSTEVISADCFLLQPDGKILVGGFIAGGNPGIIRLNADGTLDSGFAAAGSPANVVVTEGATPSVLLLQADGKILVGGVFTEVSATPRDHLARLLPDGTLDPSFDPVVGFEVAGLGLREDGTIVAGGVDFGATGPVPLLATVPNAAAARTLAATSASRVEWLRGGSAPEVSDVVFEMSTDGGTSWTSLGSAVRIAGGWEKTGLALPVGAAIRARGRTVSGQYGGSTGLVEQSTLGGGGGGGGGVKPTISNRTQTGIGGKAATLGAEVVDEGSAPVTERGVVLSRTFENDDPRIDDPDARKIAAAGTIGVFTVPVAELQQGMNYTYRAYATSTAGTGYTTAGEFRTLEAPTVVLGTVNPGSTNAMLGGKTIDDGGTTITERGVIYLPTATGDSRLLLKNDGIKMSETGSFPDGAFIQLVNGLSPSTEYAFIAFATNSEGTGYSSPPRIFTTGGVAPSSPEETSPVGGASGGASGGGAGPLSSADPEAGFEAGIEAGGLVQALAIQPDGRILLAGDFSIGGANPRVDLARLNADGTVDPTFAAKTDGTVYSIVVQEDGKILIGGLFARVNGSTHNGIARLDADGAVESAATFDEGSGADNVVYAIALRPDGKILLAGLFDRVQGEDRKGVARLGSDGGIDTSFDPGLGPDDVVYSLVPQPDGKILIGGAFQNVAGTARSRIARLEADGALDAGFDPGSGADNRVTSVAVQPDGKVLLGGFFGTFNGTGRSRIARLLATGALDPSFDPGSGANADVYTLALQANGKVLFGGLFQNVNGVARNRVARLNGNGSLDTTFDPGTGADGEIDAVALQEDGRILVGGAFAAFDGLARNALVRLDNDAATGGLSAVDGRQLTWSRGGASPEIPQAEFEISTDGGTTWTDLAAPARVAGGWSLTGQVLPRAGLIRSRGKTAGGFLGGSAGVVEETVVFDHNATVAGLRGRLAASQRKEAALKKQIKAAKKKRKTTLVKSLTKKLKAAAAATRTIRMNLAKYP